MRYDHPAAAGGYCPISNVVKGITNINLYKNGPILDSHPRLGCFSNIQYTAELCRRRTLLRSALNNLPAGGAAAAAFRRTFCPLVLVWYCITELGSIIENAVLMGAPVPAWLTKLFQIGLNGADGSGERAGTGTDDKIE